MEGNRKKYVKKEQTRTNTPLFGGGFVQTVFEEIALRAPQKRVKIELF